MANDKLDWLRQMREAKAEGVVTRHPVQIDGLAPMKREGRKWPSGSTYRYRDKEKRRAYMRDLMKQRRGPK